MNKSAKGRRTEHKSRDILLGLGYLVTRSAGSFGEWDLVALSRTLPLQLVQVRANSKPPKLQDISPYDPQWLLRYHVWKDYARIPQIYDAHSGERKGAEEIACRELDKGVPNHRSSS